MCIELVQSVIFRIASQKTSDTNTGNRHAYCAGQENCVSFYTLILYLMHYYMIIDFMCDVK